MKKLLLSFTISGLCLYSTAQTQLNHSLIPLKHPYQRVHDVSPVTGDEFPVKNLNSSTIAVGNKNKNKSSLFSCTIGHTSYDLQSNGSSCNRIYNKSVGVGGTFTYSYDLASLTFADRGTGYNFSATTACGAWGAEPTSRVETDRRGWPQIDYSETGGFEAFVSHNGDTTQLYNGIKLSKRSGAGTGTWVETELPGADDDSSIIFLWPRLRIGGANGISLHEIDISLPTGNQGVIYHGMNGALTYSRSSDGGLTWDIRHMLLPDVDTAHFSGMKGDAYSIDVKGDVVAICYGDFSGDWCIWKSTDNGTTWTRTVIREFPIPGFNGSVVGNISDVNGDLIADTIPCTDGFNAILIDNNGLVHCWTGDMRMLDDGTTTGVSFFPGTDGLLYWNENMGAVPVNIPIIAGSPDRDGDSLLTFATGLGGQYFSDITSMPSAGINANNTIYVAYSTLMENTDNGNGQSYRNIFVIASSDTGNTWSLPVNIINDDFTEAVFPSMARDVGSCVPVLWQWDGEPGLVVRGDMDAFGPSFIDYDCIPASQFVSVEDHTPAPVSSLSVYPNPAKDFVLLNFAVEKSDKAKIIITNVLGETVYSEDVFFSTGMNSRQISINHLQTGVYFIYSIINNTPFNAKFVVE